MGINVGRLMRDLGVHKSQAERQRGREAAIRRQQNLDLLDNPAGLDMVATNESQGVVDALRGLGAQKEEEARRGTISDVAERGLSEGSFDAGGYMGDQVRRATGVIRGKTELDVMDAIAKARANAAARAASLATPPA